MFCGLQLDDGSFFMFIKCKNCMMNVSEKPELCHYFFESEEAFDKNMKETGKDYDIVKFKS